MALFSQTFSLAGVNTANSAIVNLKTHATSNRARLVEVGVFIGTAPTSAPDIVLTRMNAVGTGTITSAAGSAHDSAEPASTAVLETAWATTRPTFLTTYLRRGTLPLSVGAGFIWTFSRDGLLIPINAGMVLANVAASGATLGVFNGYVTWDE